MGQRPADSPLSQLSAVGGRLLRVAQSGNIGALLRLRIVVVALGCLFVVFLVATILSTFSQTRTSGESLSVGSVLFKGVDQFHHQQRLVTCNVFDAAHHRDSTEEQEQLQELMITLKHWPRDQEYSTPSHCIYDVAEYSLYATGCQCRNPTVPLPKTAEFWQHAFQRNQRLAREAAAIGSSQGRDLDMVILGDSITEHWIGETGGRTNSAYYENTLAFQHFLTRKGGGSVDALALGIAADRIPNLLFRLQAARYGQYLRPKLWWVLIGTNDLAMGWCNVDTVVAGNIAIVEEIRESQPGAVVVIHSMLPRLPEPLLLHIDEINRRLQNYACEAEDVYFFDATSIFRDDTTGQVRHLPDGVHPNGEASWIWAREIAKAVEELTGGA